MSENHINENYSCVIDQIGTAAKRSARHAEDIHLVVVTKGQSVEKIQQVIEAGAILLGENYPEETDKKIVEMGKLSDSIEWHMIGHLQSRKIKYITAHFSMIHSIDRVEIATDLNNRLASPMNALLEVNLSGEGSKGGFAVWNKQDWSTFADQILQLKKLEHLHILGLMTMPPYTEAAESSRAIFARCRQLAEFVQKRTGEAEFRQLSMGTSIDYAVAIEEGATFVRVGEAIMGSRNYTK